MPKVIVRYEQNDQFANLYLPFDRQIALQFTPLFKAGPEKSAIDDLIWEHIGFRRQLPKPRLRSLSLREGIAQEQYRRTRRDNIEILDQPVIVCAKPVVVLYVVGVIGKIYDRAPDVAMRDVRKYASVILEGAVIAVDEKDTMVPVINARAADRRDKEVANQFDQNDG